MEDREGWGEGVRERDHKDGETQGKRMEREEEGQARGQTDPHHIQTELQHFTWVTKEDKDTEYVICDLYYCVFVLIMNAMHKCLRLQLHKRLPSITFQL